MPVVGRTPYRNLILTGTIGVGKTGAGRRIAATMEGAEFVDLEVEVEKREGYSPEQIRATFGLARLRSVESVLVEEISLRRSTVMAVSGLTLIDPLNLERLRETGPVLCLTAALGEILRRLHVTQGGWFHDPNNRAVALGRIKRENDVFKLNLPELDTTRLKIEEVARLATEYWLSNSDL